MRSRHTRGITLIELLVVISILVMLGSLVIPTLTPSLDSRKLREAARGVDVFFAAAKARAIRNGRPVGVMIKQSETNARAGLSLALAQSPDDFTGDFYNATMKVQTNPDGTYSALSSSPLVMRSIIGKGDRIQFAGKGFVYQIESIDTDGNKLELTLREGTRGALLPWPAAPTWSLPVKYRILRSPVAFVTGLGIGRTSSTTDFYQLPEGTAIDLGGSVFPGANVVIPAAPDNTPAYICIMFSPTGGVSTIYANQAIRYLPAGTIHLLIGKLKNIQATATPPAIRNWLDNTNQYVSIGHLTGQVTVTEVAPVSGAANQQEEVFQATAFARDNFALGGR